MEPTERKQRYETPVDEPRLLEESDGVLAFYKPAGLPIHPGTPGVESFTCWLEAHFDKDTKPVHRLDAPVSGLVLCAADKDKRKQLSKLFEERRLSKTYLAVVHGRTHRKGIIRKTLKDARRQRQLDAVTRYHLKTRYDRCSLLLVSPETGRKHQIRRHLHMIGHGIIGDKRYRTNKSVPVKIDRLWLHAFRLELPNEQTFECPLTTRLESHLEALEAVSERAPEGD